MRNLPLLPTVRRAGGDAGAVRVAGLAPSHRRGAGLVAGRQAGPRGGDRGAVRCPVLYATLLARHRAWPPGGARPPRGTVASGRSPRLLPPAAHAVARADGALLDRRRAPSPRSSTRSPTPAVARGTAPTAAGVERGVVRAPLGRAVARGAGRRRPGRGAVAGALRRGRGRRRGVGRPGARASAPAGRSRLALRVAPPRVGDAGTDDDVGPAVGRRRAVAGSTCCCSRPWTPTAVAPAADGLGRRRPRARGAPRRRRRGRPRPRAGRGRPRLPAAGPGAGRGPPRDARADRRRRPASCWPTGSTSWRAAGVGRAACPPELREVNARRLRARIRIGQTTRHRGTGGQRGAARPRRRRVASSTRWRSARTP